MSRDIKFRAWDKGLKRLHYLVREEELIGRMFEPFSSLNIGYFFSRFYGSPDWVLMQYTGLLDKNGKEIYEGDIVLAHWHWDGPHVIDWPRDYYDVIEFGLDTEINVEIIGNIYENPDLVEKTTPE